MPNFNEGTPLDPQANIDDGLSPADREIVEFFEMMEMKYALHGTELSWAQMSGLVRTLLNVDLHPVDTAQFCKKAGALLQDLGQDMEEIAHEVKTKHCH
ncbi:MAG: hypothetical protein ACRBBJ_08965 [Rhodomicrobiaceae bacterium]